MGPRASFLARMMNQKTSSFVKEAVARILAGHGDTPAHAKPRLSPHRRETRTEEGDRSLLVRKIAGRRIARHRCRIAPHQLDAPASRGHRPDSVERLQLLRP